jgi:molybdopterin-binding protein
MATLAPAALRRRLGLTQARFARLLSVHPMTVSKWERGALAPNARQRATLEALAAARRGGARAGPARELAEILNLAFADVSEIGDRMRLSASNQLSGRIVELETGPVSTRVVIEVVPKVRVTSVITSASARRLGLKIGKKVVAIIKATEVIIGAE